VILADLLSGGDDALALAAPGRPALSRDALRRHVADVATFLAQAGIARTDRVAMVLPDGPEMATAFLGVASAAIAAPLNPRFTAAEVDFYIGDLDPRAILVEAGSISPVVEIARRRSIPILEATPSTGQAAGLFSLTGSAGPAHDLVVAAADDCALVLHTSGTTARPKLVPLTHHKLCVSAGNVAVSLKLTAADRGLHIMPLFHIHGLVAGLLAPLSAGGSVYCTSGLDIAALGAWLAEAEPTWLTAVPTMHQAIRDWARREPEAALVARLRFIRSCSAALPPSVAIELEAAFGAPVVEAYAMTEAAHQMTCNPLPPAARKFGSVGLPAGPEVAILDAVGNLLRPGETGEVAIRGENVTDGYHDNPLANAAAFTRGWFRTGDLGALDADGYLWLTGRLKEMINRGGEKIAPIEIENLLLTHPAIAQAVAFAVPHPSLGEDVGAAIVLREGERLGVEDVRSFVQAQLSLPKVPRRILFVETLPKGPTGKLRRIGMAELLGIDGTARPPFVAPRTPLEQALDDIWCRALSLPQVGMDDDFFDLGGNSLAALQIAADIRRTQGAEVAIAEFLRSPTIAGLALAVIEGRMRGLETDTLARLLAEVEGGEAAGP
jgi:acyl-CoA synthetase (AMP-forming)/AMP-acid ligase II